MKHEELVARHSPEAIQIRLSENTRHSYLGDAVLGGIDGCVTTFAIVTGALGAGISSGIVITLGLANLLADGFSMAVSNYQSTKSEMEMLEDARKSEEQQILLYPKGEEEEVRQIFSRKGFSGHTLDEIVQVITGNRKLWVDTMLQEELGLRLKTPNPTKAALATFLAFIFVGLVPLFPFLLSQLSPGVTFISSIFATCFAFLGIGMVKGKLLNRPVIRSGLETFLMGSAAAGISYLVGHLVHQLQ